MTDMIEVTTGGQGSPVVSARALYDYLGFDSSQWSRWSKKNIVANPYAKEREDWEELDIMSSAANKGTVKDYAISLDFAKRLSMLARTEKGEQIRDYFINCEKQVLASSVAEPLLPVSVEQVLLQQAHTLIQHGQLITQLSATIDRLQAGFGKRVTKPPHLSTAPKRPVSELRQRINRKVNEYCDFHNAEQSQTYTYLYRRLNDIYRINVYQLIRNSGETFLDALERYNHLDKVHGLIQAELLLI